MTGRFAPKLGEKLTLSSSIELVNGQTMPRFGIGAWDMRGAECRQALLNAFDQAGYRHVDTARYYRNEAECGAAVRESSVPRSELFYTTKVYLNEMGGGSITRNAVEDSLTKSGLDYFDLVLLHAPDGGKKFRLDSWATLTEMVEEGKIRSLGVSNFGPKHIGELIESKPKVRPVVNQIECHPFFAQKELREVCEKEEIVVQAYCPLARGKYYGDETLKKVAKEARKTEAQVMLRWLVQHGIVALPKSSNPQRQVENAECLSFELSDQQMQELDALDRGDKGWVEVQSQSQHCD
ncbi:related to 2,5-diketo-D-gluconic acid reductase [Ustilago trichophora]|uniref:Related to 2,5-diketo-D-gluconic acid reductase n=1 Tax=Ustilago trichophora TaxID=86804 RepID=A0A5C3E5J7_9BASI|nr:related to 2,5-diketo-D-gluconic acid reductase [Ustilago trichophora]